MSMISVAINVNPTIMLDIMDEKATTALAVLNASLTITLATAGMRLATVLDAQVRICRPRR